MGVLDDAIRDHLDLKRRRGADPTEVERAEREALGPVRRAPVESAEGELELHPPDEHEDDYAADEHVSDHVGWEKRYETADAHKPFEPEPLAPEPPAYEPPAPTSEPLTAVSPEPVAPPPPREEPEPFEDVEPARGGSLFEPGETAREATVEYDVEEALDSEEAPGEEREDVLEETPEFLQDTPDHDRLWFEQKPPKDFDFDG
jgi:hypothetical protein